MTSPSPGSNVPRRAASALPPEKADGPSGICHYCGAPLHPAYYFCLVCATPYQAAGAVVSAPFIRPLTDGELVRQQAPQVASLFWTYFAVVVGVAIFGALFLGPERQGMQLFLADGAILVTTCVVGLIYRQSLAVQLRQPGFNRRDAALALLLLVPVLAINYAYHGLLRSIAPPHVFDWVDNLLDEAPSKLVLVIVFCVLPAITEEIAYRGLIQHWLQAAIAPWKAIVLASFLFAMTHFSILSLPYLMMVGCLLGWAKWRTGSLYPSMLIHFLHNFVVIEFVFWSQ